MIVECFNCNKKWNDDIEIDEDLDLQFALCGECQTDLGHEGAIELFKNRRNIVE